MSSRRKVSSWGPRREDVNSWRSCLVTASKRSHLQEKCQSERALYDGLLSGFSFVFVDLNFLPSGIYSHPYLFQISTSSIFLHQIPRSPQLQYPGNARHMNSLLHYNFENPHRWGWEFQTFFRFSAEAWLQGTTERSGHWWLLPPWILLRDSLWEQVAIEGYNIPSISSGHSYASFPLFPVTLRQRRFPSRRRETMPPLPHQL